MSGGLCDEWVFMRGIGIQVVGIEMRLRFEVMNGGLCDEWGFR